MRKPTHIYCEPCHFSELVRDGVSLPLACPDCGKYRVWMDVETSERWPTMTDKLKRRLATSRAQRK